MWFSEKETKLPILGSEFPVPWFLFPPFHLSHSFTSSTIFAFGPLESLVRLVRPFARLFLREDFPASARSFPHDTRYPP